jgi:hypothetical protein
MEPNKMKTLYAIAATLALVGPIHAAEETPWFPSPEQQQDALRKWDTLQKPPPAPVSNPMGLLLLAMAYTRYCQPLPPDLHAAVEAAMQKMTEEQRWLIDRESYKNFVLQSTSNWANVEPNIRTQVREMHERECARSEAQLKAGFGQ